VVANPGKLGRFSGTGDERNPPLLLKPPFSLLYLPDLATTLLPPGDFFDLGFSFFICNDYPIAPGLDMDASRITNTRGTSDGLSPRKRARMDPLERGSRTGYSHVLPSLTTPTPAPAPVPQKLSHSRGITACQTCRNRKTKCDNRRPACGYCAKSGTDCNYIEDNTQTTP
jgi:hypothetical protein